MKYRIRLLGMKQTRVQTSLLYKYAAITEYMKVKRMVATGTITLAEFLNKILLGGFLASTIHPFDDFGPVWAFWASLLAEVSNLAL